MWLQAPWSAAVLAAQDLASSSWLLQSCQYVDEQYVLDWMDLSPCQVACKLLVTWKLWFWLHWSVLPYHSFAVPEDDLHSFTQYDTSLVAWMGRVANNVPHLYSLVQQLLFVWWQNAAHLCPGYTCVQLSCVMCRALNL